MPKIITIPDQEFFNSETNEFITIKGTTLKIEHSLVAVAKWESKWHVAFLDENTEKTPEMMLDYIKCMTISQNVNPDVYNHLTPSIISEINAYIEDPMTATTFRDMGKHGNRGEFVTNEIIYYWMIAQNIPLECEKWHLNRLMTLIRVCSEKNAQQSGNNKMKKKDIINQNRALNAARRKASGSRG
jgi:hypothetical protein